jgi:hypothetical protein
LLTKRFCVTDHLDIDVVSTVIAEIISTVFDFKEELTTALKAQS